MKNFRNLALILILALVLVACSFAVACNKKGGEEIPEEVLSLLEDEVSQYKFEKGNIKSAYSVDEELDLSSTTLRVYLVEDCEYLQYLSEGGKEYALDSDDLGYYFDVKITSNNVEGFDTSAVVEAATMTITWLSFTESIPYSVSDRSFVRVTYDLSGGTFAPATYEEVTISKEQTSFKREEGLPHLIGAKRDYYSFDGWTLNGEKVESLPADSEEDEYALVATWTPLVYTLTFVTPYGEVEPIEFTCETDNGEVALPEIKPAMVGEEKFAGWYKDENYTKKVTSHAVIPCADTTYYARWSKPVEIVIAGSCPDSFRSGTKSIDFSKAYFAVTTDEGEKKVLFTDKSVTSPESFELTEAGEYTVKFVVEYEGLEYEIVYSYTVFPEDVYIINYELNEGTLPDNAPKTFNADGLQTLPEASKAAYDFEGWYDSSAFKNQVVEIAEGTQKDVTLYAKFVEHTYTIKYVVDGEAEYSENYTLSQTKGGKALWTGVEKEGYHFIAWHSGENFTDENAVESVLEGTYGDLTFYAELGKKVTSVVITNATSFDIRDGLTLTAEITPADAYYKDVTFEIVADNDMTGATIEGDLLTSTVYGTLVIRGYADGVYSENFTVKAVDNEITSLRILPNDSGRYIVFAGPKDAKPVSVVVETGPDKNASLDGHVLYYYFYVDESSGEIHKNDITLANDVVVCDGRFVGSTTITVSNATYHGKFTLCVELDPEPDPNGGYKFGTGTVKGEAVYTIPEPIIDYHGLLNIQKDGCYVLQADIDLSQDYSGVWTPLCGATKTDGEGLSYDNAFNGYFNGNGRVINHVILYNDYYDCYVDSPSVGFFGAVGAKGVVKNLTLEEVEIKGTFAESTYIGAAVAVIDRGTVEDVSVSGVIDVTASVVGGVVGRASGSLKNLYAGVEDNPLEITVKPIENNVLTNYYVGGALAYLAGGQADGVGGNLDLTVTVRSKDNVYVGGAIGYALGNVFAVNMTDLSLKVGNSDASNSAAALVDVGGAVGYSAVSLSGLTVGGENSKARIEVELTTAAKTNVGGIVGESLSDVTDSTAYLDLKIGEAKALVLGGIFGSASGGEGLVVKGVFDVASTSTTAHYIGGLGGKAKSGVDGVFETSLVTLNCKADYYFGGIAAESATAGGKVTITSLQSTSGGVTLGGIAGKVTAGLTDGSQADIVAKFVFNDSKAVNVGVLAGTIGGKAVKANATGIIEMTAEKASTLTVGAFGTSNNANISEITSQISLTVNSERTLDDNNKEITAGGATLIAGGVVGKAVGGAKFEIKDVTSTFELSAVCLGASNGSVVTGGLVGDNTLNILNGKASGQITIKAIKEVTAGGVVGKNAANAVISGCDSEVASINTEKYTECAKRYAGGFVGDNAGIIEGCSTLTSIKGNTSGAGKIAYVGGFAGNNTGTIKSSYVGKFENDTRVTDGVEISETTGNDVVVYVGGFVGNNSNNKALVENCYTDAYIASAAAVGGFAGSNAGKIAYSLALGAIENFESATSAGAFVSVSVDKSVYDTCLFDLSRLGEVVAASGSVGEEVNGYATAVLKRVNAYDAFDKDIWSVVQGELPTLLR